MGYSKFITATLMDANEANGRDIADRGERLLVTGDLVFCLPCDTRFDECSDAIPNDKL